MNFQSNRSLFEFVVLFLGVFFIILWVTQDVGKIDGLLLSLIFYKDEQQICNGFQCFGVELRIKSITTKHHVSQSSNHEHDLI